MQPGSMARLSSTIRVPKWIPDAKEHTVSSFVGTGVRRVTTQRYGACTGRWATRRRAAAAFPAALRTSWNVGEEGVGAQRSHVGAQLGDGAVRGDQKVQRVEALRPSNAVNRVPGSRAPAHGIGSPQIPGCAADERHAGSTGCCDAARARCACPAHREPACRPKPAPAGAASPTSSPPERHLHEDDG